MEDKSSRNRKYSNSAKDTSTNKSRETVNSQMSKSQPNDYKHFEKQSRTFPIKDRDFKETVQYQDLDSYVSQRHHFLGAGLYNTDEIEDLPPRYRQKVSKFVNRVSDIVSYLSEKYPDDFNESKNPEMKDILDLNKSFDVNEKLSNLSATQGPSHSENHVHVQSGTKSNFNEAFNRQSSASRKNSNCREEVSSKSPHKSKSSYRANADSKQHRSFVSPKHATDSNEIPQENVRRNSSHQNKSLSSSKSLNHSSEAIHKDLKFDARTTLAARNEKDYYVPRQNIKKTKEPGFFVIVNVSDKSDNLEYWIEIFCGFLKHKRFSLEFCCKFSESLVLNFETKCDAWDAVPVLKKKKDATKNLRDPHITLVSRLRYHLTRPCDCSDSMFQNCKKYFYDFMEKFVKEHRIKIEEVQREMRALKNVRNKKHREELHLSLSEKLDVLEKMQTVFKSVVSMLEEKLTLHEKFATQGTLTLKEKYILKDEKFFEFTSQERAS